MDVVIATTNGHKLREVRSFLSSLPFVEIYSIHDFPSYFPPEETGETFEENAVLKAAAMAKHAGRWALADDSGLVVPALQGAPGVYSARYAGPKATDKDNRKKLLEEMRHLHGIGRSAYFECSLVLASPSGEERSFRGSVEGSIVERERGKNGFGYDALFLKNDYAQTFAELDEGTKNKISHRAKAMEKLLLFLEGCRHSLEESSL